MIRLGNWNVTKHSEVLWIFQHTVGIRWITQN